MDFCKITEELWKYYLSNNEEDNEKAFKWIDKDGVIIGTGAHEFYVGLKTFSSAWLEETKERKDISFQLKNLWSEQKELSPDIYLVYGGVYIFWESDDKSVYIDMNSRFSMIYQKINDVWKIVHMHQSVPNVEQMDGEYYPKTLHNQIEKTKELVAHMTDLALKDGLTGLINYRGLKDVWESWNKEKSWIFVIDLDDFKQVNDTYGHIAGNEVLKKVADILLHTIRTKDAVCRMGGDEFIVLCSEIGTEEEAQIVAKRIVEAVRNGEKDSPYWIGVSVGGTCLKQDETLENAIERADQALYQIKKTTKNGYGLYKD